MGIETRPVELYLPGDNEGVLIFWNGALIAVASRLGPRHEDYAGWWHIEVAFEDFEKSTRQHFRTLEDVCTHFDTQSRS